MKTGWESYHSISTDNTGVGSKLIYGTLSEIRPEVSIMIPTFHKSDTLKEALESALFQIGVKDYEVVVVDNDAETDAATDMLLKEYCGKHKNLFYYRNEKNLGMCGNWNRCIELSRSEYLCILHDDDLLYPNYLKSLIPYAKRIDFGVIGVFSQFYDRRAHENFGDFRTASDKGKIIIEKVRGKKLIKCSILDSVRDMRPSPTACFYNRKVCLEVGGFDFKSDGIGRVDDEWFFASLSAIYPVYILPQNLALRGVSNGESSKPESVYALIIGNYEMNLHIANNSERKQKYLQNVNQIMLMGRIHSYLSTYGIAVDVEKICDQLKIPEKIRKISSWKIKAVKALLWGQACFRKEPTDAKQARKQCINRE